MQQLEISPENLYILEQQIYLLNEQVQNLTEQINLFHTPKTKEWMNCKEACAYMGISYNTFAKYRSLGLKVCDVEGIKLNSFRKKIIKIVNQTFKTLSRYAERFSTNI